MRWTSVFLALILVPLSGAVLLVVLDLAGVEVQLSSSWREICHDCRSYRHQSVFLGLFPRTGSRDTAYTRWSLSSGDERRRAAAGDAGQRLLRDWKEPGNDVSAWWEAARRFLDDPALWGIGFDNYVEVVLPAAKENREAHR